jgi:large subunit ribosomal protein L19
MALTIKYKESDFGVGDTVSVAQKVKEGEKERLQIFEGMVIAIKNRGENIMFTVRKIGVQGVGIERIFPLASPLLEKVTVIKKGTPGVRRSKLYYIRSKSPREIEQIYSRAAKRISAKTKAKSAHAASKKHKKVR